MQDQLEELRALIHSRRYVQAARDAEALIAEGALGPTVLAQVYHVQAVALYRTDRLFEAHGAARRAEAYATEWGLTDLAGRVRLNLVAILHDIGDYAAAADVGARLLAMESELTPAVRTQLPWARYNLARVHRSRRDYPLAYSLLQEAIDGAGAGEFAADALQLMAWWLLIDGRLSEAEPHIEAAGALIQPEDVTRQREQLLIACLRAYRLGDSETAVALATEFVTKGSPSTARQRIWSILIAGWVAVDQEDWTHANLCAITAQLEAIDLGAPDLMNRVNDLKRLVDERKRAAGD